MRRLFGAIELNTRRPSSTSSPRATDVLELLRQEIPVSENSVLRDSGSPPVYIPSTSDNASALFDDSDEVEDIDDAPLINLFKDSMIIQRDETRRSKGIPDLSASHRIQEIVRSLRALIPHPTDFKFILEATAKYWPLWPPCYLEPDSSALLQAGTGTCPLILLSNAFMSGKPALIAKALVFLSLCIQQLPKDLQRQKLNISTSSRALIHSYMKITNDLLSMSAGIGETIDELDILMLQFKLYLNLGMPQKAWLSGRHALNSGLLLGLHRMESGQDKRRKDLWTQIWQVDVQMSLLIGFPNAIPASHPSISTHNLSISGIERLYHHMYLIAGAVISRDQTHRQTDYSTTVKIQEDLEAIRSLMPESWWDPEPDATASLEDLYHSYATKIQYFLLCRLVHQPYMLQSTTSSKFSPSRIAALDASRALIRNYQGLRHSPQAKLVLCEIVDFEAFCAGIVLVLDLLAHKHRQRPPDEISEVQDCTLVADLTQTLQNVSVAMECSVAAQAAQLLEFLAAAYQGAYVGPQKYEVVIPYFGKVKIDGSALGGASMAGSSADIATQTASPASVQVSANLFGYPFPADDGLDAELGRDWAAMVDMDATYDWFQTFGYDGMSC